MLKGESKENVNLLHTVKIRDNKYALMIVYVVQEFPDVMGRIVVECSGITIIKGE